MVSFFREIKLQEIYLQLQFILHLTKLKQINH